MKVKVALLELPVVCLGAIENEVGLLIAVIVVLEGISVPVTVKPNTTLLSGVWVIVEEVLL